MEHINGPTLLEKARLYNRLKRRLGYLEFGLGVAYLLLMLVSGWTFQLRDWAIGLGGGPAVWIFLYYLVALAVYEVLALPVNAVSGYSVEKAFGLLNQTRAAWAWDYLKAQFLGLILGGVALELLYFMLRRAGHWWWLPAGAVFALLFVVLARLTPLVILPLFYKFKPLPESDLKRRLTGLCEQAEADITGVYEWGLSAQARKANAALIGWGRTRRVVLSDSLLANFSPAEIEVVLAHELGHFKLGHLGRLLLLQVLITFTAFILADLLYGWLGPLAGLYDLADPAGLPLLALIFIVAALVTMPAANWISRNLESQADLFALSLTGLTGSFISAMERLAALNLVEMEAHPVVEFLFRGHPSPARRIQAAKDFSRQPRREPS